MSDSALVQHLISRLESDLDFLVSHNHLSADDARRLTAKLEPVALAGAVNQLAIAPSAEKQVSPVGAPAPPAPAPAAPAPAAAAAPNRCKALWDFAATQEDDLDFKRGDIIDIVEEINADWWRGSLNGHTGVFPSNYVERYVEERRNVPPPPAYGGDVKQQQGYYPPAPAAYNAPAPAAYNAPAPAAYNAPAPAAYNAPAPAAYNAPQTTVVNQAPAPARSGMKNMMANSFVGGIGFGAGTALASEAVSSIF